MISVAREETFDLQPRPAGTASTRAHLIGAAGSGMRSLAAVLAQASWRLSGSDAGAGALPRWPGLQYLAGHDANRIGAHLDLAIYSDAVPENNPERECALQLGIPSWSYPAALGQLMAGRRGLAVAGTHGKSTAAAMVAQILESAALDPTYVFGAVRRDGRPGGRLGAGAWMIAEACEYRANFCHLRPELALLLGIEPDHFDYYRSWPQLESAFRRFVGGILPGGRLIYHHGCAASARIAAERGGSGESFGFESGADWQAEPQGLESGCYRFRVRHGGRMLGDVRLSVPARHNVLNALAAAAAASSMGADWRAIRLGLESFRGLSRRLELVHQCRQWTIIDDFAHLPSEISAGLATVREWYPGRRVWCVFQPHQASRTAQLLDELSASLQNADKVLVADIFRARERAEKPGDVRAADLSAAVARRGADVVPLAGDTEILPRLLEDLQPRDVVVTMGAGTIGKIAHGLAQRIRKVHTP